MALSPKISDISRIRAAVKFYQVSSYVTGIMLLLLVLEVALKYLGPGREFEMGGPNGFIALVPVDTVTAFNLSTGILIAHGWLYVVYLFADFRIWSLLRWPFTTFILIALGGIVPLLSFIVEYFITRKARAELVVLEKRAADATGARSASVSAPAASASPATDQGAAR